MVSLHMIQPSKDLRTSVCLLVALALPVSQRRLCYLYHFCGFFKWLTPTTRLSSSSFCSLTILLTTFPSTTLPLPNFSLTIFPLTAYPPTLSAALPAFAAFPTCFTFLALPTFPVFPTFSTFPTLPTFPTFPAPLVSRLF